MPKWVVVTSTVVLAVPFMLYFVNSQRSKMLQASSPPKPQAARSKKTPAPRSGVIDIEDLRPGSCGSLIPETLADMGAQATPKDRKAELRASKRSIEKLGLPSFKATLKEKGALPANRGPVRTICLNIGLTCNQACTHCHVESSPKSTESMSSTVANRLLEVLKVSPGVELLDITGGAPEMHKEFRPLVEAATKMGLKVQDRCNLTVMMEPGQEDLAEFLAKHKVTVVASLPCYAPDNVKKQRGAKVFERSIAALRELNDVGYGMPGSDLKLILVYNPAGPFLPPAQEKLEKAYKERLMEDFGVSFSNLYTMTNMPIKRYVDFLKKEGQLESYCNMLVENFNPEAANVMMCRGTVGVRWDGALFDCDFNLALELPHLGSAKTLFELDSFDSLTDKPIATGPHCYGCTAGAGSS
jgi:radical SAM/Cys-rich protein